MQKRMGVKSVCRHLPETVDMEAMFQNERRCRVYKDQTIRFKNRFYEVPDCLPNSRAVIYFFPWDLTRIYYGDERRLAIKVNREANARRFENPAYAGQKESNHESE